MIVATLTMIVTLVIYKLAKCFFDKLFIREEVSQTERLSEYTLLVSQSLRLNRERHGRSVERAAAQGRR